jgi:P pilus assembly chaperone PapD
MLHKATSLVLSLASAMAFMIPEAIAMEVGVSPPRFEIKMDGKTRSQSIKIVNLSSEPVEMQAYVKNWTLNENNKLEEIGSTEQSLDQWIVFTPSRFTIPPRGTQNVRFAIRPKIKPATGEHRAIFYLEEVPPANADSQAVKAVGRVGVAVYAYSGDIKRVAVINSVNVDAKPNSLQATFDVSNTGNAHVRLKGQYTIWRAANYPGAKATQAIPNQIKSKLPANVMGVGDLDFTPVLPAMRRQLTLPINQKLPPGNYVLDINGDLSGVPIDQGIKFTVPVASSTPQPNSKPTTPGK